MNDFDWLAGSAVYSSIAVDNWPGGCLLNLQEHNMIPTNATVSKDSDFGVIKLVYKNFVLLF